MVEKKTYTHRNPTRRATTRLRWRTVASRRPTCGRRWRHERVSDVTAAVASLSPPSRPADAARAAPTRRHVRNGWGGARGKAVGRDRDLCRRAGGSPRGSRPTTGYLGWSVGVERGGGGQCRWTPGRRQFSRKCPETFRGANPITIRFVWNAAIFVGSEGQKLKFSIVVDQKNKRQRQGVAIVKRLKNKINPTRFERRNDTTDVWLARHEHPPDNTFGLSWAETPITYYAITIHK